MIAREILDVEDSEEFFFWLAKTETNEWNARHGSNSQLIMGLGRGGGGSGLLVADSIVGGCSLPPPLGTGL